MSPVTLTTRTDEQRARDAARMKRWRANHPDHRPTPVDPVRRREADRKRQAAWRASHPGRGMRPYDHATRLRAFGLTSADYQALLASQGGVCAICGRPEHGRRLAVDHDHITGAVRGLLCRHCNLALGQFGDDPARIDRAASYLRGEN